MIEGFEQQCDNTAGISSEIVDFFSGSTVFLTGATGFLGHLFIEKLLRACSIKRIYITIRAKKGKDYDKRFKEIFQAGCFEPLLKNNPNCINKVTWIAGDLNQPDLGISQNDREMLIKEVNFIIHSAATVRFDEKLSTAVKINVRATKDLILMAKQMKYLKVMVHISTAYAHCPRTHVEEVFHEAQMDGSKLITLTETLNDQQLDQITPILLGSCPNTYTFTKSAAETIVQNQSNSLPITVFRPSMVISTWKEPVAGWINNFYGPIGVIVSICLGIIRSLIISKKYAAEMVPADYAVNCALAVMWDVGKQKLNQNNIEIDNKHSNWEDNFKEQIPIYNFVTAPESQITWVESITLSKKLETDYPSMLQLWHSFFTARTNKWTHTLAVLFYQTIPAHLVDFVATCLGKKPKLVKMYQKLEASFTLLGYFANRETTYSNKNVQNLWIKMNRRDKELFEFSMKDFSWDSYLYACGKGRRVYLLNDPLHTIPQAKIRNRKLKALHYAFLTTFALIAIRFFCLLY